MNRIDIIRREHNEELEKHCRKNMVSFISVLKLLDAEKTKKLIKRNAMIQQFIDVQIENAIEDEN